MHHKYLPPALALHWELRSPLGYISPCPQQIIFWVLLNQKGHIPRGTSPPGETGGSGCFGEAAQELRAAELGQTNSAKPTETDWYHRSLGTCSKLQAAEQCGKEAPPSHKEPMGMWEEASDPVMGKKDKNEERKERILNLTLEIIYLLTGEGYVIPKKKSPTVGLGALHAPGSVIQKENDKKILELISNIIQLLTGEVAIRCEDVSIYFSLEEWEYIKGNKALYREGIKEEEEEPRQLRPLGESSGEIGNLCTAVELCGRLELVPGHRERLLHGGGEEPVMGKKDKHEERKERILNLTLEIIYLLTGEVAIRCEDVSIYFSLEEWEYIKGNKALYREGIKEEEPQQLRPLDFSSGLTVTLALGHTVINRQVPGSSLNHGLFF
uniref:KRAB domain-containing protein n=1 Tax=Xenopus tropicalis TaxID=8364 RepID=A0A1B8Y8J8_XENTR